MIRVNIFAKSSNFFPLLKKNMPIFPCFFTTTSVKIFMASFKWRKAPESFPFAPNGAKPWKTFSLLDEIVWKKVEINKWKVNREDTNQNKVKYPWITGALTVYHYLSPTEFLPCFFPSWIYPHPGGGAFGQNIYPSK